MRSRQIAVNINFKRKALFLCPCISEIDKDINKRTKLVVYGHKIHPAFLKLCKVKDAVYYGKKILSSKLYIGSIAKYVVIFRLS